MKILGGDWPAERPAVLKKSFMGKPQSLLLFRSVFSHDTIPISEITSADIVTNENVASVAGKLGWGAAGALALGPVGLLAGLFAGGNRNTIVVAVAFKDDRRVLLQGAPKDLMAIVGAAYGKQS